MLSPTLGKIITVDDVASPYDRRLLVVRSDEGDEGEVPACACVPLSSRRGEESVSRFGISDDHDPGNSVRNPAWWCPAVEQVRDVSGRPVA